MLSPTFSILLIGYIFCGQLNFGHSQGGLGGAVAGAQALNGAGPAGGLVNAVPKCNAPVDHSCDDMSFNDIAGKIGGGGLMSGAQKGILGGAAGGVPGRRRRQALPGFGKGAPQLGAPAANPVGGAGKGLSSIKGIPGTSFFADPKGLGPNFIQGKLQKCDQNTKPGGQFDSLKSQLASRDFKSLTNPQAISAGDTCKKFMDSDREQCQLLKRQCCAFLNGKVKDPSQLSCAFKDIIATSGKIQAQNSACKTAQDLVKNPGNAGNTLHSGAKGVGTGLVLNQGANSVLG